MSNKSRHGEVTSARTRLDATLQLLVDKKDDGSQLSSEGEVATPHLDLALHDSSPAPSPKKSSSTSRPSRKRKRKEDLNSEVGLYHHTFVMKLFDRSVDLAQFDESNGLYPICRAWIKNQPSNQELVPRERSPTPEPEPQIATSDEEGGEIIPNVYKLPLPIKEDPSEVQVDLRIPAPVPQPEERIDLNYNPDTAPPHEKLLPDHMGRWKQIRHTWKDSARHNELRYGDSLNVLREMFDRQCKD